MMTPTMKLRWVAKPAMYTVGVADADIGGRYVLQQWWEGSKLKKEYEHLPPGSIIHWDGKKQMEIYEAHGEWRDIPIEAEE